MLHRLRQNSVEHPLVFYTLFLLPVFGVMGLVFNNVIDAPVFVDPWVRAFVTVITISLVVVPLVTLLAIGTNFLLIVACGMALIALNLLAYAGVMFIVLFPHGGGFIMGAFVGLGIGYTRAVINMANKARFDE